MASSENFELTRRDLVRAGLAGAAGALAGPTAARAARRAQRPELLPVSADVWSSSVAVSGAPSAGVLTVDGAPVAVQPGRRGFVATVPLAAGVNEVELDAPSGRVAAQTFTGRLRPGPTARIAVSAEAGVVRLEAGSSRTDPYTAASLAAFEWREGAKLVGDSESVALTGPFGDGDHYISCCVTDSAGRQDTAAGVFTVSGGAPAVPAAGWEPEWMSGAVVYGVVPPLFGQPPLAAVVEALDRLCSLGVTVLWLSPLFATTPGEFGYAVTDHFEVRPDYGTMETLQELVAEAHARGLRVILDMPLNDTSASHPYFLQARRFKQSESRYWNFYERDSHGSPVHYFSWRRLPNLSYESAEVRRLALEAARYWMIEAGVDGFRLDAAWGVAARAPGFWTEWTEEVRRIQPQALLLAEAPAGSAQFAEEGFSVAYDWGANLGEWAWQAAFPKRGVDLEALGVALRVSHPIRPFRFLDNNDTGARFITRHGPGMTKAALALLLLQPGLPCVYTGEEIGAEYLPYEQTHALEWGEDPYDMHELVVRLLAQRAQLPALQRGALRLLEAQPAASVLAVTASLPRETVVLAVNFAGEPQTATVQMPAGETARVTIAANGYVLLDESGSAI